MLEFGPSQQLALCSAGAPKAVVAAMAAHGQDAALHCHAAVVLASLAQGNKETQAVVLAVGPVEPLVAAMRACLGGGAARAEELHASCAVALAALCEGFPEGGEQICRIGGAEAVIEAMRLQTADGLVHERGAEFLAVLAAACRSPSPASGSVLSGRLAAEAVEAVAAGMSSYAEDADVQIAGCWALRELVLTGGEAILELDPGTWADAIVNAMRRHPAKSAVLERACQATAVAAKLGDNPRSQLLGLGAAELASRALQLACKRDRKGGMRVGCDALASLGLSADEGSEEVAPELLEGGAVAAVLQAMRTQPQSAALQESGLTALASLGRRPRRHPAGRGPRGRPGGSSLWPGLLGSPPPGPRAGGER